MDIQVINYILKLLKDAMEWVQELYRTVQQYGTQPALFDLNGHPAFPLNTDEDSFRREQVREMDDEAIRIAYQRMLNRNRVRRHRERKKQQLLAATDGNAATATGSMKTITESEKTVNPPANSITNNAKCITGNAKTVTCNAETAECNDSEAPGNVFAKKEKETEKRKNQRKEINKNKKIKTNIADAMPKSARAHTHEEGAETAGLFAETHYIAAETQTVENNTTTEGSCLPFQPPEKKPQVLIPIAELPDVYRKIVSAWNQLPLPKKLSGLFPSLVKRLHYLLENYGEEQVHNAIASISDSPFLLGNSKNNRGWVVSLHWFLDPEHFEKILGGEYHDKKNSGGSGFFEMGDELKPLPEGFMGTVVY